MELALNSRRKAAVFVAVLFVANLVMLFVFPRQSAETLIRAKNIPKIYRDLWEWSSSPAGWITAVGITAALWTFYFSPLRRKLQEQSQIHVFAVALGAIAGLVLRFVASRV